MDVAAVEEVPEGAGIAVQAFGHRVAVFRAGGGVFAVGARCPHAGGPLEEGYLKEGAVTCPWHGSRFDLATGDLLGGPAREGVPSFPARIEGGRVLLGPPPAGAEPPPPPLFQ